MEGQNQNTSLNLVGPSNREILKRAEQEGYVSDEGPFHKKRKTFDVVLIAETDNIQVQAHKMVLTASSEYFQGMFRSAMKEAKADEIKLKEIDGKTLSTIIEFMYTASIELCNETVERVLIAADRFQVYNLADLCSSFMGKRLDDGNCLGIAYFAEQHNATKLFRKATAFALQHFETVCKEREFFDLNKEQLIAYISSDGLRISSEENVFLSLVAWVKYDKVNREPLILDIFKLVHFTSLKPNFISKIIKSRHSLSKSSEYYKLINSWLQWHLLPKSRPVYPIENVTTRRIEKLIFASGYTTNHLKVQIYDRDSNTWSIEAMRRQPKNRCRYRAIFANEKLIFAGGRIRELETNTVVCYDFKTRKWSELPPMKSARSVPGMAELEGQLYVVGGSNDWDWLESVEKYDFATGKWEEVAPLPTPLNYVQVAVLGGLLYAVGADDPIMECYDPDINQWTRKKFKNGKSTSFGFAAVGEYLYAVGGEQYEQLYTIVERYHPSTDTWTEVTSLRLGRTNMKCAALHNRLIACRGYDGEEFTDKVEEYNPKTGKWRTLARIFPHWIEYWSSSLFTM